MYLAMRFLTQTLLICLSTAIAMQVADPSSSNENPGRAVEIHSKSLHVITPGLTPGNYIVRSEKKRQISSKIVMGAMALPASRKAIQPAALMDPLTCSKDTKGSCSALNDCAGWRMAVCSERKLGGKCLCGDGYCAQDPGLLKGKCVLAPINCKWADWEEWTPCDYTCGEGDRSRRRIIDTPAQHSGNECEGPEEETETCGMEDCPTTTTMQTTTAAEEERMAAAPAKKTSGLSTYLLVGGGAAILILGGAGAFLSQKKPKAATLDEFGEPVYDDAAAVEDYDYDAGY